jgi:1-acyl-sn-glycerol-3-phosphate acyltransferase
LATIKKIFQPFYAAYVGITFAISVLLFFPFCLIVAITGSARGRRLVFSALKYWSRGWLWFLGMPMKVSGAKPSAGKYVFVANHISYLDTVVLFPSVPGYFRVLGKVEMARIPFFGAIYRSLVIPVDRSSTESRAKSMRQMWHVLKKEASIFIFPEGTFNETEQPLKSFYDGAFRLAIRSQTPIVPVIFPDTVHRWHYSGWWKLWPGRNRAIILPVVPVEGLTLNELSELKQRVYTLMEEELRKHDYP